MSEVIKSINPTESYSSHQENIFFGHKRQKLTNAIAGMAIAVLSLSACSESPETSLESVTETVDTGDVDLHVRSYGPEDAKEVLVAVHGGPGLSHETVSTLGVLADKGRRVVMYDQRGAGNSTAPESGDYSLEKQVDDLDAVREWSGADTVDIVGKSWGGLLGAAYAASYPDNVDELVLLDAIPLDLESFRAGQERFFKRVEVLQEFGTIPDFLPQNTEESCLPLFEAVLPAYLADPLGDLPEVRGTCTPIASAESYQYITRPGILESYAEDLSNFNGRALVVMGEHDPFGLQWLHRNTELLSSADTTSLIVEDAGHFSLIEEPDDVLPVIDEFLR